MHLLRTHCPGYRRLGWRIFLVKVGPEFDPSFVKLHVGTNDVDELLEFIWERADLSPLVDAGLKPLLRNKLYRAILEERAARGSRATTTDVGKVMQPALEKPVSVPAMATSASMCEIETTVASFPDDASSASLASQPSVLLEVPQLNVCTSVKPHDGSSTTPVSSPRALLGLDAADFPALGSAGTTPVVPQAKHTSIAKGTAQALPYHDDDREHRRKERMEIGEAKERAERARQVQEVTRQRVQAIEAHKEAERARQTREAAQQRARQDNLRPPPIAKDLRLATATVGYGRQFGSQIATKPKLATTPCRQLGLQIATKPKLAATHWRPTQWCWSGSEWRPKLATTPSEDEIEFVIQDPLSYANGHSVRSHRRTVGSMQFR